MPDHTVTVDRSGDVSSLSFSTTFNVAVPFIDRHLDEGRAGKVVIRTTGGDSVTYGTLAENVNRCGNALTGLNVLPAKRVLMIVKDYPAFFYTFWGAIKAGIVPVPLNTLLRAKDYQYMIEDSAAATVVYSPEFAAEVEPALSAASHKPARIIATEGKGGGGGGVA
jgi:acyl-coenzyme A synthetase/AMP-(fatty) acid ligase